jgi:hypothetical protein
MIQGKHVKMIIHADGTCDVDAVNFKDATCMQATQQILRALSGTVTHGRFKPEAQRLPPQANEGKERAR